MLARLIPLSVFFLLISVGVFAADTTFVFDGASPPAQAPILWLLCPAAFGGSGAATGGA
jgi:hypothetical protein